MITCCTHSLTCLLLLCILLFLFEPISPSSLSGELGDKITSEESRDIFFASLDNNGNGKITLDELTGYIEGTGGNSLDEQSEIQSAVSSVLKTLDLNQDEILKKDDFALYWKSLTITGYDFMELLANDGALLEQELGITRHMAKMRLLQGIKMKLLGMGTPPPRPLIPAVKSVSREKCFTHVTLSWQQDAEGVEGSDAQTAPTFPIHRYQLQRQTLSPAPVSGQPQRPQWVTVYEGPDTSVEDTLFTPPTSVAKHVSGNMEQLSPPHIYSYRLSAWNRIGRSELSYLKFEVPGGGAADGEMVECESSVGFASSPEYNPYLIAANSNASPLHFRSSQELHIEPQVQIMRLPSIWTAMRSSLSFFVSVVLLGVSILVTIVRVLVTAMPYLRFKNAWRYTSNNGVNGNQQSSNPWDSFVMWIARTFIGPAVVGLCTFVALCSRVTAEHLPVLAVPMTYLKNGSESLKDIMASLLSEEQTAPPAATRQVSGHSSGYCSSGDEGHACSDDDRDLYSHCSICHKKFKFRPMKLRWRKRHHCCRCFKVFCDNCGMVTHNKVLQCPVPGTCECLTCAGIARPPQTSLLPEGIAAPSSNPSSLGVAMVSSTALAMHNRAVPSAESAFKHTGEDKRSAEGTASSGSGDADSTNAASTRIARSNSLRVHSDRERPSMSRMNSITSVALSSRSCPEGVSPVVSTEKENGRELSKTSKVGNRSFGSLRSLMTKSSSKHKVTEDSRPQQEARSTRRAGHNGLPPKPPSSNSPLTTSSKKHTPVASPSESSLGEGAEETSPGGSLFRRRTPSPEITAGSIFT